MGASPFVGTGVCACSTPATDEFSLVLSQGPHWSAAGHEFVARTLGHEPVERGPRPEPRRH